MLLKTHHDGVAGLTISNVRFFFGTRKDMLNQLNCA